MKDEYIIINKKLFKKRIEELEKDPIYLQWEYDIKTHNGHSPQQRERKKIVDLELELLKEILSESTPLIPVLEDCYESGVNSLQDNLIQKLGLRYQTNEVSSTTINSTRGDLKDYISNLKLDI